jgi:hypothetical protein
MSDRRPVILIAAHGERGGAANNQRLASLVEAVSAMIPEADVGSVLASVEGVVPAALAACGDRPVICLPLLFSDGFFMTERLKPFFHGEGRHLARPFVFWPRFTPFLADNLALRLISRAEDPRVILIAHGSQRSSRSAEGARYVGSRLAARYGRVEVGFLEQAPFAAEVIASAEPPYAAVGLFFGDGLHGGEDFDVLVGGAPKLPAAAFTVGDIPSLPALVADEARVMLERLPLG